MVYVERGRVVARGTHAELLASVPGYAHLVTAYERAEADRERERALDSASDDSAGDGSAGDGDSDSDSERAAEVSR